MITDGPVVHWKQNTATKMFEPSRYPSDIKDSDYTLPSGIQSTFTHLNNIIETKYTREYIKLCAFYNKLFPSLKSWDWGQSTHNAIAFSWQEQERYDGSAGIAENFLKKAIDQVVARVANIKFDAVIQSDIPSMLLEMYKNPVERYLKGIIKNNRLTRLMTEVFHDAAILNFGHLFIDPWSGDIRKIADWELGCYESEFAEGSLKRALIRDFAFPVTALGPYIEGLSEAKIKDIIGMKPQVDLKLFVDAVRKEAYVTIETVTLDPIKYDFDEILLTTFSWDIGVKRTLVASAFDMGYPLQRSINKLNAKKTQLIENYKGPVPVFNNDCDVIVKSMGNSAGEALFLASGRNPAEVLTVINPTPLDPEMNAEKETQKSTLQELIGAQELSLDMENIRSAATVIALDQLHDKGFQSQLTNIGATVSNVLENALRFAASRHDEALPIEDVPWEDVVTLLDQCYIEVQVLHNADPQNTPQIPEPDYNQILVDRACLNIMRGHSKWEEEVEDYLVDSQALKVTLAMKMMKLRATNAAGDGVLDNMQDALLSAFIDDISTGAWVL